MFYTSYVIYIPENLTHVFHLITSALFSQFWSDPIHIASVFVTSIKLSPDQVFSKRSSNSNNTCAESNSDRAGVLWPANCSSLVSKPPLAIPLMFS